MNSNGNSVPAGPDRPFQSIEPAPHLVHVLAEREQLGAGSSDLGGVLRAADEGAASGGRGHQALTLQVLHHGLDGHLGDAVSAGKGLVGGQPASELTLGDTAPEVGSDLVRDGHGTVAIDAHTTSVAARTYGALVRFSDISGAPIDLVHTSVHYQGSWIQDTYPEDDAMDINDPASLADCTAPLGPDARRAVMRYWDRVTAEEWVPPADRVPRLPSLAELDERRNRRRMRRQLTSVTRQAQPERAGRAGMAESTAPDAA